MSLRGPDPPSTTFRERLALPSSDQDDSSSSWPDTISGLHAHHYGLVVAQEVYRVRDLLAAHYIFGRSSRELISEQADAATCARPTTEEIFAMDHAKVVETFKAIVPRLEGTTDIFRRIETDAPFARQVLCGALSTNQLSEQDGNRLFDYLGELSTLAAKYRHFALGRDLFAVSGLPLTRDTEFARLRKEHRRLFVEISGFLESNNWFSPSQFSSWTASKGVHQSTDRNGNDYGRSYPELLRVIEGRFAEEMRLSREISSVFLTGGGLQALNTALGVIAVLAKDSAPRPVVAPAGVYWESDERLRNLSSQKWVSEVISEPVGSARDLADKILATKSRLVMTAPFGNSPDMATVNIGELLTIVSSHEFMSKWQGATAADFPGELIILVDNTVLSNAAQWKSFNFQRLPQWCAVGSVESLIKQGQDGFDYAPSGSLTWYSRPNVIEWFNVETPVVRARGGYTPPPNTLLRLMLTPSADYLEYRGCQHRFNTRVLSSALSELGLSSPERTETPGIQFEVVTPGGGAGTRAILAPFDDRDSPIFYLKLSERSVEQWRECLSASHGQELDNGTVRRRILSLYIDSLLDEARASGVSINEGTSFGFDVTRISPISGDAIRVAPGIEHIEQLELLKNTFVTAAALLPFRVANSGIFQQQKEQLMNSPLSGKPLR